MSEHESRRRVWAPDWRLLLFAGAFLPVLLGLGFWQLDRADEKHRLLAQWEDPAGAVDWHQVADTDPLTGQPVTVSGRYRSTTWLLDNRTRDGIPGYEVLTLFQPGKGPPVVVNRGWIAAERKRSELPQVKTPEDEVSLLGRIAAYPEPPVLAGEPAAEPAAGTGPQRVQALPREVAAATEPAMARNILKLDDSNQPGAFRADWEPDMMGPQTHYGYALQWFSLAA
ncbi:MAG: SURF1 family protein, partial [Pseudomonadota bacterium]